MPQEQEWFFIQKAEEYIRLSNQGELQVIFAMFEESAIYVSSQVGKFEGKQEISNMMRSFFHQYESAVWEVPQYKFSPPNLVSFDFVMRAFDSDSQCEVRREGTEKIAFSSRGLIQSIRVRVSS